MAMLLCLATGLGAGSAHATSLDGFYGVNVQQVFGGSPASWQPQLGAMAAGGLQLARIDARWSNIEPTPPSGGTHTYNWSMYDGIVQGMAQAGLRWYPIVAYSTSWSGSIAGDTTSVVAPAHVGDFAAFAAALARRYGRGGSFWATHPQLPKLPVTDYEIWNEENSTTFMHPQTSAPEAYADLYMAARGAIKAVDPQASVVIGGLALGKEDVTDEARFIQRMYAHRPDLAGHVDGVGLHPYQQTLPDTYARLAKFRQALDQVAGTSVPIEITELGWATTSVSEADRATDLQALTEQLPRSDCNISRFLPYTWLTQESDPSNPEDWFGIWNRDGSGKPSGIAYLDAVKLMRGLTPAAPPAGVVRICHPDGARSAGPHGPKLRLRVVKVLRGHWVKVSARCRPACILRLGLFGHARASKSRTRRLSVRVAGIHARRKVIKLRIRGAHTVRPAAQLRATAMVRSTMGVGVTKRFRHVRIR
ncbi:MAG TPA: hypothetical protein VF032_02190 [Thermoleophilaceae bacterium]